MHHPNLSHSTCKSSSTAHGTTEFMFATTAASRVKSIKAWHVHNVASFLIEPALHPRMHQSQQRTATSDWFFIPWHQGHPHTATSDIFFTATSDKALKCCTCRAKTSITCGS